MSDPKRLPRRPDGRPAERGPALPDGDVGPAYEGGSPPTDRPPDADRGAEPTTPDPSEAG